MKIAANVHQLSAVPGLIVRKPGLKLLIVAAAEGNKQKLKSERQAQADADK